LVALVGLSNERKGKETLEMKLERGSFPHLSDDQYEVFPKLLGLLGGSAVEAILLLPPNQQISTLENFLQGESNIARQAHERILESQAVAAEQTARQLEEQREGLEHRHEILTSQLTMQLEILQQQQAAREKEHELLVHAIQSGLTQKASPIDRSSLRLNVSKYSGKEGDLPRWILEIEMAMETAMIAPEHQVAYAISYLTDRSRIWALNMRLSNARCFPTWEHLKQGLLKTFQPPMAEFRMRQEFARVCATNTIPDIRYRHQPGG
jgi:hypothetical protein